MTGTVSALPQPSLRATYKPLPWQVAPWRDTSFLLLLTGSAGGGKSRVAAEKLHGYCLKYPGAMALAVRKTKQSMVNSTLLVLERRIIDGDPAVKHNQQKNRFEYANGSILAYGGMKDEDQRQQIRSIGQDGGLDICWMEEANAFTEADFNELLARMRGKAAPWRQVLLSTNPDAPHHWIYRRLIQGGEARVFRSGAKDNTHNAAEYLTTLQRMTGLQKQRLADGEWVRAEGVVYDGFNPDLHVLKTSPAGLRRHIASMDWGFTNPGVILVWGIDGDGRMYLVHEVYRTRKTIDFWITKAKALRDRFNIDTFVCDPAEPSYIQQFREAGLIVQPGFNDITPGIQAVSQRLKPQADDRPRLYLIEGANEDREDGLSEKGEPAGLADEMAAYSWTKTPEGKPNKEEPEDKNNHAADAARYAVAYLDDLAGLNITITGGQTLVA